MRCECTSLMRLLTSRLAFVSDVWTSALRKAIRKPLAMDGRFSHVCRAWMRRHRGDPRTHLNECGDHHGHEVVRKRPPVTPCCPPGGYANGSNVWISRSLVVGSRVRTSVSQAWGSRPLALAVAIRLMMAAARRPAVSEPAKSQFLRPTGMGRMAFLMGLLCVPCKGVNGSSVRNRPGKLSFQPEAQGAVQEATNGLKHFLKRPRRRSARYAGRNVSEH